MYYNILICFCIVIKLIYLEYLLIKKDLFKIKFFFILPVSKICDCKLHFLFVSLIIHSEYFFINPRLKDKLLKDKKNTKLYRQTDSMLTFNTLKEIKNLKKYPNYLINEVNEEI